MSRTTLLVGILLALTVSSILTTITLWPRLKPRQAQLNAPIEIPIETGVKVQVYREGRLIHEQEKAGDRLVYNFWALILNSFLGRGYSSPLSIYRVDGSTFTVPDWEYVGGNPMLTIGIGSGSASINFFDVELNAPLTKVNVTSSGYTLTDNGTHIIVTASASWTATSTVTAQEVGLYWRGCASGSSAAFYVLIARDLLSPPVYLVANDVITITYTISIRYNGAPIVRNLAAVIANYILGAKNYGRTQSFVTWAGSSVSAYDIGHEFYSCPYYCYTYDNVNEYLYIGVTGSQIPYLPQMSSVPILAETASGVTVSYGYNSTHVWFTLSPVSLLLSSGGTVYGVFARIRNIDVDAGSNSNTQQLLVLYFPLDTPVTVPESSGVKISFTIYFRW